MHICLLSVKGIHWLICLCGFCKWSSHPVQYRANGMVNVAVIQCLMIDELQGQRRSRSSMDAMQVYW